MKVCLSNNTFRAFEKVFRDFFKDQEVLLLDQLGNLIEGEGKPEVVFASYEIMFKCLHDQDYRKKIFSLGSFKLCCMANYEIPTYFKNKQLSTH